MFSDTYSRTELQMSRCSSLSLLYCRKSSQRTTMKATRRKNMLLQKRKSMLLQMRMSWIRHACLFTLPGPLQYYGRSRLNAPARIIPVSFVVLSRRFALKEAVITLSNGHIEQTPPWYERPDQCMDEVRYLPSFFTPPR